MIQNLLWTATHYNAANRVAYGSLLVDPGSYFEGAVGLGLTVRLARLTEALLPSLLPALAYLGLAVLFWCRRANLKQSRGPLTLLFLFSTGLLLAGLPRLAAHQLFFMMAVFVILCSYVLYFLVTEKWLGTLTMGFLLVAVLFWASSTRQNSQFTQNLDTPAGSLRCKPEVAALLSALVTRIHPGDGLFVFPYLPAIYFVTGGQNPAHYSFLQPGLMTGELEATVLGELQAHPPRWILWWQAPTSFWLTNWPNSNPDQLHFPLIESFIQSRYRDKLQVGRFVLECQIESCDNRISDR